MYIWADVRKEHYRIFRAEIDQKRTGKRSHPKRKCGRSPKPWTPGRDLALPGNSEGPGVPRSLDLSALTGGRCSRDW